MMIRSDYTFSNSKAEIERLVKERPEFKKVLEEVLAEAKFAREHFRDRVEWLSGWWHNFCCPHCASLMIMDAEMPYNSPNVFTCSKCGKTASSTDLDEAWVYGYRSRYAKYAYSCAISAILGDTESLDYLIRYVDFYADNYDKFPIHGNHAGKAKVMEQHLDEAVWVLNVVTALMAVDHLIPAEKKLEWRDKLFVPMVELVVGGAASIHNICTWRMAAVGAIAVYCGDEKMLDYAVNSEFGIRNQLAQGFTADGIWQEGSVQYHNYTVSALSFFLAIYATVAPEDKIFDDYARVNTTLIDLLDEDFHLPAINDGWYPVGVPEINLTANRLCTDRTLGEFYKKIIELEPVQVLNAKGLLFFAPEEKIKVLADTRLAVVKKPFHMIFKAGSITRIHTHQDCLSVILPPFSDDIGTPGYGHELVNLYYKRIVPHNSVAVDYQHPAGVPVTTMERIEDGVRATVTSEWFNLTHAERSLTVEGDSVRDVTILEAPTNHIYDWFFHSIGKAEYSTTETEDVDSLGDQKGYQYITDIKRMKTDGSFKVTFTLDSGKALTLEIPSTEGIEVYTAKTPDNPADKKRNTIVLRRYAKDARFEAIFTRK